jgi:hypothetical protein
MQIASNFDRSDENTPTVAGLINAHAFLNEAGYGKVVPV